MWKDIPGYESCYQASDNGEIRSVDRLVSAGVSGVRMVKGQIIKASIKRGYKCVILSKKQRAKTYTVHSLVMLTFVGPRPNKMQILHADDDRTNNRLCNLSYDTTKKNHEDKVARGRTARGTAVATSKLTEEEAIEIRTRRADGETLQSLANEFGISTASVSNICFGVNWKYAGGPITPRKQHRRVEGENRQAGNP